MAERIFVSRRIPEAGLGMLREAGVEIVIGQQDTERGVDRATLLAGIRQCDVLISLLTERIDAEALYAGPRLRGVANMAVGFNNIDVATATTLGIPVSNTPGVLTETTADLTWALLLALARRVPESERYLRAGRYRIWGPDLFLGTDVGPGASGTSRTLGIIGYGRIGRAVARRAHGFDMRVLAYDVVRADIDASDTVTWAELDTLIAASDFITLHVPLTTATRHLIDERTLRLMKPSAILITTARGELVHEHALVTALREHWIAGAALDVYEDEPALAPGLADCPNAVLVPHIGSASTDTRDRMARLAAHNALAHLRGERAPNPVNPEVYDLPSFRSPSGAP
ncbi:MAG: D-glycerate dehydrogenase [Gemmatimonadetes bacterium]|nr:D-glycerate dehydrogenase [Gemmatimonadota bacterium]